MFVHSIPSHLFCFYFSLLLLFVFDIEFFCPVWCTYLSVVEKSFAGPRGSQKDWRVCVGFGYKGGLEMAGKVVETWGDLTRWKNQWTDQANNDRCGKNKKKKAECVENIRLHGCTLNPISFENYRRYFVSSYRESARHISFQSFSPFSLLITN